MTAEPSLLVARVALLAALSGLFLGAFAVARSSEAHATVSLAVTYRGLVETSSAIVVATPRERRSAWQAGRITTYTRLHVERAVAGTVDVDVWVRTLGGEVDGVGQLVDGEASFALGRPTLVFLRPAADGVLAVTSRAQGIYELHTDARGTTRLARTHAGALLAPRAPHPPAAAAALAADVLEKAELGEACSALAAAFGEARERIR
ncbi:MAG: hypothetical protein IPF92_28950 [Myxococcales bacterium]|jgi:hypothetical protein|nr:hypothetical protein [Myxococcales bacterium]